MALDVIGNDLAATEDDDPTLNRWCGACDSPDSCEDLDLNLGSELGPVLVC